VEMQIDLALLNPRYHRSPLFREKEFGRFDILHAPSSSRTLVLQLALSSA